MTSTTDKSRFQELLLDFLSYQEFERGSSQNTLSAYRTDLLQFGSYLKKNNLTPETITQKKVNEYLNTLVTGPGFANTTLQRKIACLRSFFKHLRREGLRENDPVKGISLPKCHQGLPKVLGRSEIRRLLAQPSKGKPLGIRDRAILELMYACGLRTSEIIEIELTDIDLEAAILRARGKGSKERLVPIGSEAVRAVRTYAARVRPDFVGSRMHSKLFVNVRGAPLTRQGLYKIIMGHAKKVGIEGKMTPHTIRHTFATHLLAGGCDLRSLQEMLGHADVSTTQIYTHLSDQRMKEVYFETHPRARS